MNAQQHVSGEPDRIRDVVRDLVAAFAPDEASILEGLAGLSDAEALRMLRRQRNRRDPLGFGVEDLLPLLTPVLWIAVTKFVETVVEDGTKTLGQKIRDKIRRQPPETMPRLTPQQIDEACDRVRDDLIESGFDEADADAITAALRRRLK